MITNWLENGSGASGLSSRFEEDQDLPDQEEEYERPGVSRAASPHRRLPSRNLDPRAEVVAAWLIVLERVTVSMGGQFAILGAGDILK